MSETAAERATAFFTKTAITHKKLRAEADEIGAKLQEAADELTWAQAHPALKGVDLAALYENAGSTEATEPSAPDAKTSETEQPKAKRTRRTKAQIAADKAAEEAAKNGTPVEANESDDAAQAVEGQGLGSGFPSSDEQPLDDGETDAEAAAERNTDVVVEAPVQAPVAATPPPPAAPAAGFTAPAAASSGDFNPFGPKA